MKTKLLENGLRLRTHAYETETEPVGDLLISKGGFSARTGSASENDMVKCPFCEGFGTMSHMITGPGGLYHPPCWVCNGFCHITKDALEEYQASGVWPYPAQLFRKKPNSEIRRVADNPAPPNL